MHVGVAGYPREHHHLPKVHDVELRRRRVSAYGLGNLLVRALILIFGQPLGELAHVFHRHLGAVGKAVDAPRDVTQLAVAEAYQAVRHGGNLSRLGHVHGEVFKLGQCTVRVGLRLEDEAPPKPYDGEAVGLVAPATVDVERQLGLHSR